MRSLLKRASLLLSCLVVANAGGMLPVGPPFGTPGLGLWPPPPLFSELPVIWTSNRQITLDNPCFYSPVDPLPADANNPALRFPASDATVIDWDMETVVQPCLRGFQITVTGTGISTQGASTANHIFEGSAFVGPRNASYTAGVLGKRNFVVQFSGRMKDAGVYKIKTNRKGQVNDATEITMSLELDGRTMEPLEFFNVDLHCEHSPWVNMMEERIEGSNQVPGKGFGDPWNKFVYAMEEFDGGLFVGTKNMHFDEDGVGRTDPVIQAKIDACLGAEIVAPRVAEGCFELYASAPESYEAAISTNFAQIWRLDLRHRTWTLVWDAPTDQRGKRPKAQGYRSMAKHQGSLYVSADLGSSITGIALGSHRMKGLTSDTWDFPGCQLLRTDDGHTFNPINSCFTDGPCAGQDGVNGGATGQLTLSIQAMASYNGVLYVGTLDPNGGGLWSYFAEEDRWEQTANLHEAGASQYLDGYTCDWFAGNSACNDNDPATPCEIRTVIIEDSCENAADQACEFLPEQGCAQICAANNCGFFESDGPLCFFQFGWASNSICNTDGTGNDSRNAFRKESSPGRWEGVTALAVHDGRLTIGVTGNFRSGSNDISYVYHYARYPFNNDGFLLTVPLGLPQQAGSTTGVATLLSSRRGLFVGLSNYDSGFSIIRGDSGSYRSSGSKTFAVSWVMVTSDGFGFGGSNPAVWSMADVRDTIMVGTLTADPCELEPVVDTQFFRCGHPQLWFSDPPEYFGGNGVNSASNGDPSVWRQHSLPIEFGRLNYAIRSIVVTKAGKLFMGTAASSLLGDDGERSRAEFLASPFADGVNDLKDAIVGSITDRIPTPGFLPIFNNAPPGFPSSPVQNLLPGLFNRPGNLIPTRKPELTPGDVVDVFDPLGDGINGVDRFQTGLEVWQLKRRWKEPFRGLDTDEAYNPAP